MKRIIMTAFFICASLMLVESASAQTIRGRVEIPFSFIAGDTQMPPGVYTLKADGNFTSISREGASWAGYTNPNFPSKYSSLEKVKLVFAVYGDQHFLREIEYPAGNLKYEFRLSKAERKAQQHTPNASAS